MQDVVKDQNGFIWLLHRLKIQRFDGKLVKEFAFDETMFAIICDDQNNIWAASRASFYRYDDQHKKFNKIPHDTTGNPVLGKFLLVPGHGVVANSNKCFYVFDGTSGSFKKIKSGNLSAVKTMGILAADIHGHRVFVQSGDTLCRIDIKTGELKKLPGASDLNSFRALDEDKVILSSFNNYSYWFDFKTNTVTKIDIGKGLGGQSSFFLRIHDVGQLNADEYLISSIQGLLLYNARTDRFRKLLLFAEGKPVQHMDLINFMVVDSLKNVWLVYHYNGLIYFRATEGQMGLLRNAEIEESRSWHNSVRNFAEDENGNLWLATLNGFAQLNLETGKFTAYQPSVNDTSTYSFPSMRGIACRGDYVILGPTNRGLWLYHTKKKIYRRPVFLKGEEGDKTRKMLENDFIDNICKLKNGNFIVSARDCHYFMDGKSFLVTIIRYPGEKENGNFAYQDKSGNIWLGNQKKLYCFDSSMKYVFRADMDVADNISTMLEIESNTYLVAGRGLFLMKKRPDNSTEVEVLDNYFKHLIVSTLFRDKYRKIWIGTSDGIIRYDMDSRKPELFNFFDITEGNLFYARSCILSKTGVVFFGGVNGVNYMIPENMRIRKDSLKIIVTRLAVNNQDLGIRNTLRFKPFQNTIDVEFAAPYFSSVNRIRYRYWLEGLDKEWISNGYNNAVRFSSLAPGAYRFKMAASINNEDWFESGQSFSFVISTPIWKTWWFRSLVGILIVSAVYLLYRYQLNKRLEVERLRYRISRDLHDDIGSTLSSINILARSSMGKNSEQDESNTVLLQKIQQRSQRTLDAMDDLIWNTKPENDSLESLIIRMREYAAEVLEAAGINYTLNCPATIHHLKLDMQQKKNLYLIFKEAVNNLAKYSKSSNAMIGFDYQKKFLHMLIADEGSGFSYTSIKKGNGLDNMQSRAAEMNAQFDIQSGNGRGTTIRVNVPV